MALTYNQITAITEKLYLSKLTNNVYDSNAFLKRLTRPGSLMLKDGGTSIVVPLINSKPSEGAYFDDLDTLSTNRTDNITAAQFEWKQLHEPVRISRKELLQNNGDAAKLSLIQSKVQVAERNIKENLSLGLYSDGTAATGAGTTKQLTGLQALMSESSTYGGIAVADMAEWIANVVGNSSVDRALTLALMQQAEGEATFDMDRPTVALCRQNVYDQAWSLFQPSQRLMSEEMAGLGFKNVLEFNGKPILVDNHAPAKTIYFVNEDFVKLCVHREENLRKETLERLETSNSMLMRIFWMGNLVCQSRRTNASLEDIEVAS